MSAIPHIPHVDAARWVDVVRQFGRRFRRVAGTVASIAAEAARVGRRWFQGVHSARWAFAPT